MPKPKKSTVKPQDASDNSSSNTDSVKAKLAERLAHLEKLKALRNESQRLNREDVKSDFRKKQTNEKLEEKNELKRGKAERMLAKQTAEMNGEDYARHRSMHYTIEQVEQWEERQQQIEENKTKGFTDYVQVQAKKYQRDIRELKPNLHEYSVQKAAHLEASNNVGGPKSTTVANAFYRDADSLSYANPEEKVSKMAVARVVEDLAKQLSNASFVFLVHEIGAKEAERRKKASRRREFNEDDDVTYINERNMHFNKKVARAYDKYTGEIRGNFERGTAL
ncbi:hypothetical protein HDU86_002565 [Geranomyces michiganensis]|nr:hypothetical protein HDU86_002565 [Geranomyces michiganensis]